jgi:uncharacterized protein (TIGR02001 family)
MPSWGLKTLAGAAALPMVIGALTVTAQSADLPAGAKVLPPQAAAPAASLPFDIAFGAKLLTDYNFRGISQSDRNPAAQGYVELQAFDNLIYVGTFVSTVDLPTRPDAEVDLTFGVRPKLGPVTFDFGGIAYFYPGERQFVVGGVGLTPRDTDFVEIAGKASYTFAEVFTVGAAVYHAWDWLGTGADGTYVSGTAKWTTPIEGVSVSGELGHYFLGRATDPGPAFNIPDYTYWNVGVGYTFKNITVDLRYHDTDATRSECFLITTDPAGVTNGGRSRWCNPAVVASLAVDFTASQLGIFAPR